MQHRLRDYKEPILSFDHNLFNLGLHNAGRYCGFDTISATGALTFSLTHQATGITYKDPINTVKGPVGVLLSPQGMIIMEDAAVTGFSIDSNAGNAETRYDLLVCTHNYTAVEGGAAATYSIIKGTMGSPVKPILTDPYHQIAIGVIELPPNANDIANCTYTRFKSPDSGDGEDARLNDPNVFKATQMYNVSSQVVTTSSDENTNGAIISKLYKLNPDGNVYKMQFPGPTETTVDGFVIKDMPNQNGCRISILANDKALFRNNTAWQPALASKGYKPLNIPGSFATTLTPGVGNGLGLRPTTGETWELEFLLVDNVWWLVKIGGVGNSSTFKRGMTMEWYGDLVNNFDESGLGINLLNGWAICNGNNGTPDRRGKLTVMATNVPALNAADISEVGGLVDPDDYVYINAFTTTGKKQRLILQDHLPDYALPDPGHSHQFPGQTNSNHPSGGSSMEYRDPATQTTATAFTGITLGGGEQKFPILNPVFASVYIMKV